MPGHAIVVDGELRGPFAGRPDAPRAVCLPVFQEGDAAFRKRYDGARGPMPKDAELEPEEVELEHEPAQAEEFAAQCEAVPLDASGTG